MKTLREYPKKFLIGRNKGEDIYLSAPSWDCDWYWGFGYLGNENRHYNVEEYCSSFDDFKKHFGKSLLIRDSKIWVIVELFNSFYKLREAANLFYTGCSGVLRDIIINKSEWERINKIVLPKIFDSIYNILLSSTDREKQDKEIIELNIEGDAHKIVDYMIENEISTDDLPGIKGLTQNDINIIHSLYYDRYYNELRK